MTRILIILISTIGFFSTTKADTIDYWHVYYNQTIIKKFNQFSKGEITLKIKDIKKTDSLTVKYFRNTPCGTCETRVEIEDSHQSVITTGQGIGTFNPIKISLFDLLVKADRNPIIVYYYERQNTGITIKVELFSVKLQ